MPESHQQNNLVIGIVGEAAAAYRLTAGGPVADERLAFAVDCELDVGNASVDQLRSGGGVGERRRESKNRQEYQDASTHERDPSLRQVWPHDSAIGRTAAAL